MSNLLNIKDQSGNWVPIPVVTNGIKSITQNEDYTLTITLNDGTTYTTTSIKGEDGQDYILTEQDKQEIAGLVDTPVDDVQINGTSILQNGVANIPLANSNDFGVVKLNGNYGIQQNSSKLAVINRGNDSEIKLGTNAYKPIVPYSQHMSTFYGLAKSAGDTTQSTSSNAVGTYTDSAKTAIKNMLGVIDGGGTISETITGTDPTITAQNNFRYMCGELYTLNFTPCVSGVCEVIFTSGTTPTVLTLPDTVRMPAWWTGVEANTTYEISIVDGVYGAVMSWS